MYPHGAPARKFLDRPSFQKWICYPPQNGTLAKAPNLQRSTFRAKRAGRASVHETAGFFFKVVLLAAIWTTACAAFAAMPAVASPKPKPITVAMSMTPLSAPFIIADEKNYFSKNGLNVSLKEVLGGYRAIMAIFDGEADIATSSETVVMFNSFLRSDFVVVCTFVSSDNDVKIITRKDTGIENIRGLSGHRIGTVKGASAEFFLDHVLRLNRVKSSSIEIVHVDPEDSPDALEQRTVDAIVVWEPYAHLARKRLGAAALVVPHDRAYIETFNAIVARKFATNNPDVLEGLMRALIQASHFLTTHREASKRIVTKRLRQNAEAIDAVWEDLSFGVSLHQSLLTTLEAEARWAVSRKIVPNRETPNYLEFLFTGPLERVSPQDVTIFR